uniref:ZT_dimer domain-containing protein n=1 Tax=Rhabditophanes sp. KR3021 TaxID=114890 RepID=A0AC35U0P3_9BILA
MKELNTTESTQDVQTTETAPLTSSTNNSDDDKKETAKPNFCVSKCNEKKVSKYYDKQKELLEAFEEDKIQIQKSVRRRNISQTSNGFTAFKEKIDIEECPTSDIVITLNDEKGNGRKPLQDATPLVNCYDPNDSYEVGKKEEKAAKNLAFITLIVNILLLIIKAIASYLSGSFSILSSFVDSAVDITSGLVIWLTVRAIAHRDGYLYPRGRTRLEPLALIIVSVIMGVASIQMIIQSVKSVIDGTVDPHVDLISGGIMISTIIIKFILVLVCSKFKNNVSVDILAQDHRNDCISNFVALICAVGSRYLWIYLDVIGAIVVSCYITFTWFSTGKDQMKILSGRSAKPDFIKRIIKICVDHDERIKKIDTVLCYHFGTKFLIEAHVILDENMILREAHDISEALQNNIESLNEVERAFVHSDYSIQHPSEEHQVV